MDLYKKVRVLTDIKPYPNKNTVIKAGSIGYIVNILDTDEGRIYLVELNKKEYGSDFIESFKENQIEQIEK